MTKGILNDKWAHTFQQKTQRRIIYLFLFLTLINFLVLLALSYEILFPREPAYFATSINGKTRPLEALDQPNLSDMAVSQWANQAAIAASTYDFVNYNKQLLAASEYFTNRGWDQFVRAIQNVHSVDVVESKKLIVSAVALRPPTILKKGMLNGVYAWRIQMPLLITYRSASEVTVKRNVLTLLVVRVPTRDSYKGIGIEQFYTDTSIV